MYMCVCIWCICTYTCTKHVDLHVDAHVHSVQSCIGYCLFQFFFKLFGVKEFLPSSLAMKLLSETVCLTLPKLVCENLLFVIAGSDVKQLNTVRLSSRNVFFLVWKLILFYSVADSSSSVSLTYSRGNFSSKRSTFRAGTCEFSKNIHVPCTQVYPMSLFSIDGQIWKIPEVWLRKCRVEQAEV